MNNWYDYLSFHYNGKNEERNPPYSLKQYMRTDKKLIFKIAEVNYEEGPNTFEFLVSTLFTNYNIQTSGVIITAEFKILNFLIFNTKSFIFLFECAKIRYRLLLFKKKKING